MGAPSVELMPLAKPGKYTVAGSPGITMLVLSAVKPRATTSLAERGDVVVGPQRRRAQHVAACRARVVPQCDQYSRMRSRIGPPNSS